MNSEPEDESDPRGDARWARSKPTRVGLVLHRGAFERIFVGNEFTIEFLALKRRGPALAARILFGLTLKIGERIRLDGEYAPEKDAPLEHHQLIVELVESDATAKQVRIGLWGSERVWQEKLARTENEPTWRRLPDGVGISVLRSHLRRLQVGRDFCVTVASVEAASARMDISALLFEGEVFTHGESATTLLEAGRNCVRLGIKAPSSLVIDREEVVTRKEVNLDAPDSDSGSPEG